MGKHQFGVTWFRPFCFSSFSVVLWKTGYFSLEWERECVIVCVMYGSGFNK